MGWNLCRKSPLVADRDWVWVCSRGGFGAAWSERVIWEGSVAKPSSLVKGRRRCFALYHPEAVLSQTQFVCRCQRNKLCVCFCLICPGWLTLGSSSSQGLRRAQWLTNTFLSLLSPSNLRRSVYRQPRYTPALPCPCETNPSLPEHIWLFARKQMETSFFPLVFPLVSSPSPVWQYSLQSFHAAMQLESHTASQRCVGLRACLSWGKGGEKWVWVPSGGFLGIGVWWETLLPRAVDSWFLPWK